MSTRDVDALFKLLASEEGYAPSEPKEWVFCFRHDDVDHLAEIAEELADEFQVDLQETVETQDGDKVFDGPPLLSVAVVDALSPEQVKKLSARFTKLAADNELEYEGVDAYDPTDAEEFEAFIDLPAGVARLASMTESGMPAGTELVFEFCLITPSKKIARAVEAAVAAHEPTDVVSEQDEEGRDAVLVYFQGTGDKASLSKHYSQMQALAKQTGASLEGVRFLLPGDEEDEDED